jgi:septal ring factor EnvC (AmiA/AmiB activator)
MLPDQEGFISGRIYAIKARLEKAQRRIERAEKTESAVSKTEQERAHRLAKLLVLHETDPEEALRLYEK